EYLETAIDWISEGNIEDYMGKHQHDTDATVLWEYFEKVIDWVNTLPRNKKIMKGVDWGNLYNTYNTAEINKQEFEQEISKLILDDDVTKKIGIYPFLFTRNEKHLSIRAFTDSVKLKVYEKQKGICTVCKEHFAFDEMEADHITPWHDGGKTIEENCQMLCKDCNRRKSGK
ncbi:MAG: HNH endonuclease, partial [Candidatus Kapabacteria bacterium]|nr:HNH endonuclease [Candidatus Kapabacteria bacterium]